MSTGRRHLATTSFVRVSRNTALVATGLALLASCGDTSTAGDRRAARSEPVPELTARTAPGSVSRPAPALSPLAEQPAPEQPPRLTPLQGLPQELFPGLTLYVAGPQGEPVPSYRWLIEEDVTYRVVPGVPDPRTLSVSFHRSYMPAVAHGDSTTPPAPFALDPDKRYFVSVLPDDGFSMGGTSFGGGDSIVAVRCPAAPLPVAQLSVFVFEDNAPVSGTPDLPAEQGLAGFQVMLIEAGGRYGMAGGPMMMDIYNNPIGTTYNPDGSVAEMGRGFVFTDASGNALIKNLSQGKFTVEVLPPRDQGWIQTSTIEGTRGSDAWVKPNEPSYFQEFGPPGWHTFFGFVKQQADKDVLTGQATITGQIVNMHMTRPPNYEFFPGVPFDHTVPYVALNDLSTGGGRAIFVTKCADDGSFAIPNVPVGRYELAVWDENLDVIFAHHALAVAAGDTDIALGQVPVFQWFGQLHTYVFSDVNGNGMMDKDEPGIPEVGVNIRWRDGSMYQSSATDVDGFVPFQEIFPFFAWQVAEVDGARFKLTGMTAVVDDGGPVDPDDPWSFGGLITPQLQPDGLPYRVQLGDASTQAFQSFIGTANAILWGKQAYDPSTGENGGIRGVVYYDVMRGTDEPQFSGYEPYEPGIPRVQVALYRDGQAALKADVDNWPYDNFPGPEDVDRDGNGQFDLGDAIAVTHTLGWDDAVPTDCVGPAYSFRGVDTDCYDGLRNFNQVRPGIYDGMYSFTGIPSGRYIVEVSPPRTAAGDSPYSVTKEEDRNYDFGDSYGPSTMQQPPACVGELHRVPEFLTLFPDSGILPRYHGQMRPLCDRRRVSLNDGQNGNVDFFLFTEVPIAGHIVGFILDDAANEFDPNAPTFGEKFAPPWLPVSIRDFDGTEIGRTYSDEYGVYNALVPSTFTTNSPVPSGMAPKMLTTCMNDPGPIPDPAHPGRWITDPHYNPQYSQFCYTLQYMPGTTTYLDTPVIPVAAFAGPDPYPLDCELGDGVPHLYSVSGPQGGPYVATTGEVLTLTALGATPVPNPLYDGANGTQPKTILRDFGFGDVPGSVSINGRPAAIENWSAGAVTVRVAIGTTTGDLVLTRGDNGKSTVDGVRVTVGSNADTYQVLRVPLGGKIQSAIDAARPGDLILVPPGTYRELVVMWKPVRLQGWGPGSTHILAAKTPAETLVRWRAKVVDLIQRGLVDLIPNQANGVPVPAEPLEPLTLFNEEGPGILVLAKNANPGQGGFGNDGAGNPLGVIDGFSIGGGDNAGGIMVNGYARRLRVSNNRIQGNAGTYGGGIRFGHPFLLNAAEDDYQSAFNERVVVTRNEITRNGGLAGVGGGIAIYTGTDRYTVTDNFICGNFSAGHGGGIGHLGLSDRGLIEGNTILYNETFYQASSVHGGGIFVGGEAPIAADPLSPGSGSVLINRNLIQGNGATSGDGGGIRLERTTGREVMAAPDTPARWNRIDITNNMLANNVAGMAGGAISLQDAARVSITHNTAVHNDSTATAGNAFTPGNPNQSNPQPAGIVAYAHSPALAAAVGTSVQATPHKVFSNPQLINNVIWHNRSFSFAVVPGTPLSSYVLLPDVASGQDPSYWDLAVLGAPGATLRPLNSILTSTAGYDASNLQADPLLVATVVNGAANEIAMLELTTAIQPAAAFDEGGNFIKVRYGPLSRFEPGTGALLSDAHLQAGSPAIAQGMPLQLIPLNGTELTTDFDGQPRPNSRTIRPDIGADQR